MRVVGPEFTSMSRAKFEELRQGIIDGSLAQRWGELENIDRALLTKKQQTELRQLSYIVALAEEAPDTLRKLITSQWRRIRVFDVDGKEVLTEVIR